MGTTPPAGAPWWVWLLVALVTVVVPAMSGVLIALINRPVKQTLKRVQEQTENEHAEADYPNLRDELTAARLAAEQAAESSAEAVSRVASVELSNDRLEKSAYRHDSEIAGLREEQRQTRGEVSSLRQEHHETRQWVGAEATERKRIGEGVRALHDTLEEHLDYALQRDEAIAELREEIKRRHPDDEDPDNERTD